MSARIIRASSYYICAARCAATRMHTGARVCVRVCAAGLKLILDRHRAGLSSAIVKYIEMQRTCAPCEHKVAGIMC